MATKKDVVLFLERFTNDVLIPCAKEGMLDEEGLDEAVEIYIEELQQQESSALVVSITKDGEWRDLHPLTPSNFELNGRKFISVTHCRYAYYYFEADDEVANHIMEARTPEVAHRRGEEMESLGRVKREDWEYMQKDILKKAYHAILSSNKELLKKFLATKSGIEFTKTTDNVLGDGADGKGKNLLPLVLKELRKEMI